MCVRSDDAMRFPWLLHDPLIRLVMKSDGVTEQEMIAVVDQLRRSLTAREACMHSAASQGPRAPSDRTEPPGIRAFDRESSKSQAH